MHGGSTRKVDLVKALGPDTGSVSPRSLGSARTWTKRSRVPGPVVGRDRLPVRVPRRHLLQGAGQAPGGVPGGVGVLPHVSVGVRPDVSVSAW